MSDCEFEFVRFPSDTGECEGCGQATHNAFGQRLWCLCHRRNGEEGFD